MCLGPPQVALLWTLMFSPRLFSDMGLKVLERLVGLPAPQGNGGQTWCMREGWGA